MISDFKESLGENLESVFGLDSVWGVELVVNFSGFEFGEASLSIEEISVFDVQMNIAECNCDESRNE